MSYKRDEGEANHALSGAVRACEGQIRGTPNVVRVHDMCVGATAETHSYMLFMEPQPDLCPHSVDET